MKHVTRLLLLVGALVVLPVIVWTAWAYWTASGTGTASATVGSLTAPTNVVGAVTPGNSDVAVTWTGMTTPTGGAVDGYYVERFAGAVPSPACASSAVALLPSAPTSCSDLDVPDGAYTYKVTAVFSSWTATSTASSLATVNTALHFTVTAPASATAGASFTVTVVAKDALNVTVTGYRGTIAFTSSDPGSPVLPANYTFTAGDNGTHTFTNGASLRTTPSQTVVATDTVTPTILGSTTVTVNPGAANKLAVTQQTTGGNGGVAWTTQPKVTVQDTFGNTITSSAASVTLAITAGTGTSGATLTCTTNPRTATSGVAIFAGCKINKSGTGYTLTATSSGLTSTVSAAFDIVPDVPTKVVYTVSPTSRVAGVVFSPSLLVTIQDAVGNTVTSSSATVNIAIGTNPGGGTLSGTVSETAVAGVATFDDLSIDKVGTGYTLVASSTGLTSATSATFNITVGTAAKLGFTLQTTGGTGGVAWTTQPRVNIQDAFGNTVTTSTASVTLAITSGTGTSGAALTCTANPKAATAGVDTFAGCKIDKAGVGYTLTATSGTLTSTISTAFDVTVGPATKVVYTQAPVTTQAGSIITPSVVATLQDAGGNTVTSSSATVNIAIGTNPVSGTLTGTLAETAVAGVATFDDLAMPKVGTGYTLVVSSTGLTSATSATFNITVGPAAKLAVTTQTTGGTGGVAWATQPKVTIQDAFGNTITTSTAAITAAITPGTGTSGAALTCTVNPRTAVAGIATFAGCKIDKAGTGYTLTMTASGLTSAISSTFDVTVGPATKVVYSQQPTSTTSATTISPAITATIQDAGGNTVTTSSATVNIAIGTNPGTGTLSGDVSEPAVAGVVTFSGLSINKIGTGYTLVASSTGLTSATSSAFNITLGAASKLAFTTQTTGGAANAVWTTQPKVTIQDAGGNTITTATTAITLAITSGTGTNGAVLTCTVNPRTAVAGISTWAGCKINLTGTAYTLTATASGLTTAISTTFNIT